MLRFPYDILLACVIGAVALVLVVQYLRQQKEVREYHVQVSQVDAAARTAALCLQEPLLESLHKDRVEI